MISALFALGLGNLGRAGIRAVVPERPSPVVQQSPAPVGPQTLTPDEQRHQDDLKHDREEGKRYSADVAKELTLVSDPVQQARLDRIGHEIADIANHNQVVALWGDKRLNPFDYDFHIVVDKRPERVDDVNAFSIPGGHIYVFKAMLKFCESDDELAGVLAHEIAHAALRHVATLERQQSKLSQLQIPALLVGLLLGGLPAAAGVAGTGGLITQSTVSGWSVQAEEAADYGGFQYLLKSHYDPTGMLTAMERLALMERNDPLPFQLGIFRDHPPSRERANSLIADMNAAHVPIRRSRVASTFRAEAKPMPDGTVQINFGGRLITTLAGPDAFTRADRSAEKLNVFFDSVPEAFEVQPGDGGAIVSGHQPLVEFTPNDVAAAKLSLADLQSQALAHIRSALFSIGYRVWDTR